MMVSMMKTMKIRVSMMKIMKRVLKMRNCLRSSKLRRKRKASLTTRVNTQTQAKMMSK